MNLLVDLGNTRLKWALASGTDMRPAGVFAHVGRPLADELVREWAELPRIEAVYVASVVGAAREQELDALVHARLGLHARFVRSPSAALGIRNAYTEPARLGVDRFLALAAAHARAPRLQVLIGSGTALTVDALAADGIHLGGIIVASPRQMRQALLASTARVDAGEGGLDGLPRSTSDAVATGALYAVAGAIDRFCDALARARPGPVVRVLSGGGAGEIEPLVGPVERAHDLVLHGLALWAAMDAGAGGL